jgi:hypothetical protein
MASTKIFAKNFRGFSYIEIDLVGITFLLGDNSSGKSSILHLIDAVLRSGLNSAPQLKSDLGVAEFDYFSPIFSMREVVFGFKKLTARGELTKIITVERRSGADPHIRKCSYFYSGRFISIKHESSGAYKKILFDFNEEIFDPLKMHEDESGYEPIKARIPEAVSIAAPPAVFLFFEVSELTRGKKDKAEEALGFLFGVDLPSSAFVGPIRSLPEKYYEQMRGVSPIGLHFASMWAKIPKKQQASHFKRVGRFGEESGLFDSIRVEPVSSTVVDSPLLVHVVRRGHSYLLNQVGVGVSQVAPVLTEAIYAAESGGDRIGLFQQPELHLHPIAQAALGTFFATLARDGFIGFLETHSNYLIDRFRVELRLASRKKKSMPNAKIIFCSSGKEGNTAVSCAISGTGEIIDPPDAYYEFFLDEAMRTMM